MRRLAAAALSLALLAPTQAFAKKKMSIPNIDFGAYTCSEFIADLAQGDEESAGMVLLWIDGYLSGVSGDAVLNWKNLESFSENIINHCGKNPNRNMLDAAKKVGIE